MLPMSLVQMAAGGKEGSTPSSPERSDKGLQRDAHKDSAHFTARLPEQGMEAVGQRGTWEPVRLQEVSVLGGGREVPSQEEEKRKHCISSSFSLGEKENFRSPGRSISLGKHKEPGLS